MSSCIARSLFSLVSAALARGVSRCASRGGALVSLIAVVTLASVASAARADFVYGLNGVGAKGIHLIDTATGGVTLAAATPSLLASGTAGNALAFDSASNAFYYIRRSGSTNFFVRNTGGVESTLGVVPVSGTFYSATFHNGHYWAIRNGLSNSIVRLTPVGGGFTQAVLPLAFPPNASFGDIASTATGLTYASCSSGFLRFDLNALGTPAVNLNPTAGNYQIAFGNTGLFAVQGTNIYSVNTMNGVRTFTAAVSAPGYGFNDLASIPAPGAAALLGLAGLAGARRRRR
jgi:MYXO-CTERM domain-containing protein